MYKEKGLNEKQIDELVILDLKNQDWFDNKGISNQHAGGWYFAYEEDIMNWLFVKH